MKRKARPIFGGSVKPVSHLPLLLALAALVGSPAAAEESAKARGANSNAVFDPTAKPPSWTQKQKSAAERGVNPCNTKDPGFGDYDRWERGIAMGQMIAPKRRALNSHAEFDLMVHFHGHEAVRKEWVQVMHNTVLVGVDLGIGSGPYETAFAPHGTIKALVESVEKVMAKRTNNPNAHIRRLGLSAWSAGYGAVQNILSDPWGREHVDTVVLLDGLHCGYQGKSLNAAQLKPFLEFSARAADGERLMVVTHSSIIPPGYASTTETANFLISKLGGRPMRTQPRASDPMGLELISRYSRGSFHVRGFAGNDTLDHCAQIGLFRDVLKVHVLPRWKSRRDTKR
ncbi:MAG: hypothetical protein ACOY0T_39785 [Myxococcota bacterium]